MFICAFLPVFGRITVLPSFCFVLLSFTILGFSDRAKSESLEEVITIGSRSSKTRTLTDIPVPVDIIKSDDMEKTSASEVGRILQTLAPSFNFSSSSVSDGTDALRPATLRGLGPDQVLVLVNGKRRHNSALLHVNTSVGRGSAGADMNAIPASAIKRIEILRDGASAQYGSDAIAGVINIVLKDRTDGQVSASYGETHKGDGENIVTSLNSGRALGESGYVNGTIEYRNRGRTNRSGLDGTRQYPLTESGAFDEREANFNRQTFRVGDADSEQVSGAVNTAFAISDLNWAYGNLTFSRRENASAGFYRKAEDDRNPLSPATQQPQYPNGFLPRINTDIDDLSLTAGVETQLGDWVVDSSAHIGANQFAFHISHSLNASHVDEYGSSPTAADAGEVRLGLSTFNIDVVKEKSDYSLAIGGEYRIDRYQLIAGEPLSYLDYSESGSSPAGIQVFPGYKPENEVDETRRAFSLYSELEWQFAIATLISTALRYENYSDFGHTLNGKLAIKHPLSSNINIRSSLSTGFRAPSMQQLYFNNISTQFTGPNGTPQERVTARNDSQLVRDMRIPKLKEEESVSFAAGFTFDNHSGFTTTIDYYTIKIDDRIVISGAIPKGIDSNLDTALAVAGAGEAQVFLNAANTHTEGIELVSTYSTLYKQGNLGITLSGNYTTTQVESLNAPVGVAGVPGIGGVLFTEQDISIIEQWQPKDRISINSFYGREKWQVSYMLNRYGKYTVKDNCAGGNQCLSQTFSPEWVSDIQLRYALSPNFSIKLGGHNIFNAVPDENTAGQSRASPEGGLIDPVTGALIVDSKGVFTYSRRSAPFGFNGAYFYLATDYRF